MRKLVASLLTTLIFMLFIPATNAQKKDWRFGFEDTWSHLSLLLKGDERDSLLVRLELAVEAQEAGGDTFRPLTAAGLANSLVRALQ